MQIAAFAAAALALGFGAQAQQPTLLAGENVPHGTNTLVLIDLEAGTFSPFGGFLEGCHGLAASAAGRLYGRDIFQGLVELDPTTGAVLRPVPGFFADPLALTVHPVDGRLFAAGTDGVLYVHDPALGTTTAAPQLLGQTLSGLSWSRAGTLLYAVAWDTPHLYTVDPVSGVASLLTSGVDTGRLQGLTTHPVTGELLAAEFTSFLGPARVVSLSPVDGARTPVAESSQFASLQSLAFLDQALGQQGCPGEANSSGNSANLRAFGFQVPAANRVTLDVRGLPPGQVVLPLAARTAGFVQAPAGSQGDLCLGSPFVRFPGLLQAAGPGGRIAFPLNLQAIPSSPPRAVLPGETWYFQAWYRDLNPGPTSNFSSSLVLDFP